MSAFRVLCVDDDELDAEQVRRVARRLDPRLRVEHLTDGDEALAHLERVDALPHLVLLDLNMPRLDGHGCLRAIRSDPSRAALPVAILTTSMRAADRNAALVAGATDYLVKPLTREALARLLARARWRPPAPDGA